MIWLSDGARLDPAAKQAILAAAVGQGVFVSPVSAWEVALLSAGGRFTRAITPLAVERWYRDFIGRPGIHLAALTSGIALDSASLPDLSHRDPADRFLIATARQMGLPLVTRDRKILDYADTGHVRCIPC